MKKEVVCIKDGWLRNGEPPPAGKVLPKKDEIYIATAIEHCDCGCGGDYYHLEGWNPNEDRFDVGFFADITKQSKEMVQQINKALKAPNPDWRPGKLSPTEKEWMKGFGKRESEEDFKKRLNLYKPILEGYWTL